MKFILKKLIPLIIFVIGLLTMLSITRCKKTVIQQIEYVHDTIYKKYSWQPLTKFPFFYNSYKIIYSKVTGRPVVLFYNPTYGFVYDSLTKSIGLTNYSPSALPADLNHLFGCSLKDDNRTLYLFMPYVPPSSYVCYRAPYLLDILSLDTTLVRNSSLSHAISETDYRWVITLRKKNSTDVLLVLDFRDNDSACKFELKNYAVIPTTSFETSLGGSFNNRFIVNMLYDGAYLLREDNTISYKFGGFIRVLFNINNTIYVYDFYNYAIYKSSDNGETWQVYRIGIDISPNVKFKVLRNNVFAYVNSTIYSIDLNNNFDFKILKNDGIEDSKILDMFYSNDTVIISTTRGLFYKRYSDFIIPK
jgi:hypothetical protein